MTRAFVHLALHVLPLAALLAAPQTPTTTGKGTATAPLPELGEPAVVPDGAPKVVALVTRQKLREHAYWLADDARKGRYTSSDAQKATADYVKGRFLQLGLEPLGDKKTFVQSYPLEAVVLHASSSVALAGIETKDFGLFAPKDLDKLATNGKVAWCKGGRPEEIPDCKGKIAVVLYDKVPRGGGTQGDLQAVQRYVELSRNLKEHDARLCIVLVPGDGGPLLNTVNYYGLLPGQPRLSFDSGDARRLDQLAVPIAVVGGPSAAKMLTALGCKQEDGAWSEPASPEKASAKVQLRVDAGEKAFGTNVCAVLPGTTQKHEAIVVSAHHDHVGRRVDGDVFNGADDNASGTSGLLVLAEAFAKCGERPARSVIFLSVSGEELGLWGSAFYADHPTWPIDKIVADVNIDMIGRPEPDGDGSRIQITPSKDHDKYSSLGRLAAQLAPKFALSFTSGDAYYERSDHYQFAKKGIPVVFLCDGEHPDYHQVTDTADRLDYPRMEAVARVLAWTAWDVAQQKERPKELGRQANW